MKIKTHSMLLLLMLFSSLLSAQTYDLLIKGGRLIDPKNNLDAVMDIAITDGKVARVAASIPGGDAKKVIPAEGLLVTPGLIDIHGHVFHGTQPNHYLSDGLIAVPPDGFTFRSGVTTIVDCGGPGWKNFDTFKKNIIDPSKTRVLAFMNIVGEGMRGGAWEQNTGDMDAKLSAMVARQNRQYVVGFKVAHYSSRDWIPIDRAVEAGKLADMPVIVDFGGSTQFEPLSIRELFFERLRPGDIYTHAYAELNGARETVVNRETREFEPFVLEAQKRGIIFDVGYGGASFEFKQAIPALAAGLYPNTISTDLHTGSMNAAMKNMLNVMTTFLAMGMELPHVISASTWEPAQVIQRTELGHLTEGAIADLAILNIREGNFGVWDRSGQKIATNQRLECEMTIKDGQIMYDFNGLAAQDLIQ
ncbi:amidohydrolase/deacetylase family metallohydrolase [Cyclobacterium jeungdonense]|uniref:Amidohydrolase/deacetylase family metallohydrolase n=1 Tax=Cyclobacterium jeungdonense TaxID=708087 RepID=A0ABT8C5Z2_9BACT|nr:amidohydrolase/deacetylase family metallohydrolase [Cyclobacterium jeungdonense]MDN3687797.1 amidohydrolase/deacetylase family metallohydrolase [Cyclobacterium jeungdonense]